MKAPAALALLVLSAGARGAGSAMPAAGVQEPPKLVVLVVLESVRADHVGVYGYDRPTTPCLDALAGHGLLFERAYAGSSNAPQALSTLWTGRLPTRGGAIGLRWAEPHPELVTLPRLFRKNGFRTALVTNRTGLRSRGFTRGFDDFEVDYDPGRWSAALVTEKALELLDQERESPLLLVAYYADSSEPYLPEREHRGRFDVPEVEELVSTTALRAAAGALPEAIVRSPGFRDLVARYDAEIARVDGQVGALLEGLRERGALDDALVAVTSSHGMELLDHGYVGSSWTLHEEVLRVPLVIAAPGRLAPGRVSTPVSLADVVPTLARLFGFEGGRAGLDGEPFLRWESGALAADRAPRPVLSELIVPELAILRACIEGDRKGVAVLRSVPPGERFAAMKGYEALVRKFLADESARPDLFGPPTATRLYDLAVDPGERNDLTEADPDLVEWLEGRIGRYLELCRADASAAPEEVAPAELPDPEALEGLKAIGYL